MADAKAMVAELKAAAEVELQKYIDLDLAIDADMKAAEDKGYDQALKDQQVPPETKIYTEEDLQAEKLISREQGKLEGKAEGLAEGEAKVVEAVKAKGLEIAKKIRDANVDDLAIAAELEA